MKGSRRSFRYPFLFGDICGAYAIRPYPDGRMDTGGSIGNPIFLTKGCRRFILHSSSLGDICGAYAIRPYPDGRMDTGGSIGNPVFLTKRRQRFFRYSFLFGDICGAYIIGTSASVGKVPPKAAVFHPHLGIFVGRMQYAPTLTDEWIPEDRLAIQLSR